MRIGISSAVLYPEYSEISMEKLTNCGFEVFEFFYNCDEEISLPFIEKMKTFCNKAFFISIHPYTAFAEGVFFFSAYERRTREALEKYKNAFRMANELGVKYFTLHGDRLFGNVSKCILTDKAAETLSLLADSAKEEGITLCLENVSWCKSSNPDYIRAVSEKVRNIGFTLDLKQARRANIPYEEYIDAMGSKILNIHVSDFDTEHDCLLPGKGIFDFNKFKKEIEEIGYRGDLLIEVYSEAFGELEELASSKRFLEKIFI